MRFLLTGFAGFLRIEDLLDVKVQQLKLQESDLEILVPKSNADQHSEGHVLYTSRIKSEYFLVKYLEVYLQKSKLDISNDKEIPLMYRISKTKSGHKVSKTKGVLYSRIRKIFKS